MRKGPRVGGVGVVGDGGYGVGQQELLCTNMVWGHGALQTILGSQPPWGREFGNHVEKLK